MHHGLHEPVGARIPSEFVCAHNFCMTVASQSHPSQGQENLALNKSELKVSGIKLERSAGALNSPKTQDQLWK